MARVAKLATALNVEVMKSDSFNIIWPSVSSIVHRSGAFRASIRKNYFKRDGRE
jgi:hypothetical protein